MAETWINGFFFEYNENALNQGSLKGIQYSIFTDLISEPISNDFFKAHAKIDFAMDDSLITSYIKAARQELEQYTQKSFGDKVISLKAKELPKEYRLMYGPVKSILIPNTGYEILGDIITFDEVQKNVEVRYEVSWGAVGLPEAIKIAIAQTATGLYYRRENRLTDFDYATVINQAKQSIEKFGNRYFV